MNLDPKMDTAIDLVLEFIESFYKFVAILTPAYDDMPTEYCMGFNLGLEGSMMLAKVANKWISPTKGDGEGASMKDFNPR